MAYIKYGVVTKIETILNTKETKNFVKEHFDLSLYDNVDNKYYLKSDLLNDNLESFRKEVLEFTKGKGDSIDCYEAFYLNTTGDELLKNKIELCDDNESYFFSCSDYKFETDKVCIYDEGIQLNIHFIAVFWDTNRVEFENILILSELVNNLIKKCSSNKLKDASFLAVI